MTLTKNQRLEAYEEAQRTLSSKYLNEFIEIRERYEREIEKYGGILK